MSFALGAAGVATVVLAGFALAGVNGSNQSQTVADQTRTTTQSPAPTASSTQEAATPTPPATSPAPNNEDPAPVVGPLDWDGGRWDVGNVVSFERDGQGVIVVLDRYQMWQFEEGWLSEPPSAPPPARYAGKTLIRYPLVVGNTDTPFLNESSKLHRYRLADNAEVVRVSNRDEI
ncbi:MAG: hypothetical protein ACRDS1_14875, partial [Pseudonocardiaceae bacterium]